MTTKAYPEISSRRHQIVCRGAIELMIIICKEPRTDLGQKGGKSSDFNDDALSGSHENIWRMIKQRSHHYNKRAAISQSVVSSQPNKTKKNPVSAIFFCSVDITISSCSVKGSNKESFD